MLFLISLIAFFAWIGLGADGLSSSCYGPEEAFLTLGGHTHLSVFVALLTAATIFVIGTSYSQIVELFPSGGGGYKASTRLIGPYAGLLSGSALIVETAGSGSQTGPGLGGQLVHALRDPPQPTRLAPRPVLQNHNLEGRQLALHPD